MNPHIFREYDIRGIWERDLNRESVTTLGRAFGTTLAQAGRTHITLGRDCRLSSPDIRDWLVAGLLDEAEGADMLMVKPAGPYLDVIARVRDTTTLPVAAPLHNWLKLKRANCTPLLSKMAMAVLTAAM